ncbi:hypothetical protein RJ639_005514 [Escallonia herrerae]|uniref:Trichome birefringence-like N-terminal domain-containing protein n=1 Tax=Escallonia herrerae TaxID=1293975 RepID=A0AA88VWK9_9ASTE|nr:hypothetical protein RJ639_005514 [Escallonia herrerae]
MDSFKNLMNHLTTFLRNLSSSWSKSRTHSTIILLVTIALIFFFSASDTSPTTTTNTTNLTSGLHSAATFISSLPSMLSSNTHLVYNSSGTCSVTAKGQECHQNVTETGEVGNDISSCDIFDGQWIADGSGPLYLPGSCPFIDDSFNCFNNGRTDSGYLKLRWKPHGCHIPRFDGLKMLEMLRGKRVVFVGDSLNRNMWESLVCALRASLYNKSRVFEASGRRQFRTQGFYSFRFKDYRCSIDFIKSPFLVQEWKIADKAGTRREMLRLDMIQGSSRNDWRFCFCDIGRGGQWQSGGNCDGETEPITSETHLAPYPWMMSILESVIAEMKTPVFYLNVTRMTDYRKDGHPSIFRPAKAHNTGRNPGMIQDCSHWCLPGVPDTWNELLFATLLTSHHSSIN